MVGITILTSALCFGLSLFSLTEAGPIKARDAPAPKTLRVPLRRSAQTIEKRDITVLGSLKHKYQAYYEIELQVGTPPQPVSILIDTGSSNTWVGGVGTDIEGGLFNPSLSSTAVDLNRNWTIRYGTPGSQVTGKFYNDQVTLSGKTISNTTIGVALTSKKVDTGILGLGFQGGSSTGMRNPTLVQSMVAQKIIDTESYSLWLDDLDSETGEILFGGYDSSKYTGKLITIPTSKQVDMLDRLLVKWTGLNVRVDGVQKYRSNDANTTVLSNSVLLDSGSALSYIPKAIMKDLAVGFNLTEIKLSADNPNSFYTIDCRYKQMNGFVDFTLGGNDDVTVEVPYKELVIKDPSSNLCLFGLAASNSADIGLVLGATFLRSAYVYYNLGARVISLANSNNA